MAEKNLIKAIKAFVFLTVIGTPFFYWRYGVYPYTLAKILFFQAAVEILFFLWLALAVSSPRYRPRPTPLLIAGGVFLSAMFLASINGVDFWRSFWSTYERGIGLFAFLHLAALGMVVSSLYRELPWKKIFYGSLIASVAVDLIAYAQFYIPSLLLVEDPGSRPGATFGNPTFMAGYLVLNVFIAIYLLLSLLRKTDAKLPYAKIFFVAGAGILDAVAVFFVQTRGDIVGLAAGIAALLLIFAMQPPEKVRGFLGKRRTYIASLAVIVLFVATFLFTLNNPVWKKVPGLSRFQGISFSSLSSDSSLLPRLSALRAGWQGFIEKPLLGWGPENFTIIFDRHYDPRVLELSYEETHADKTHNMFLEYADAGGIVLFLALLLLFGTAAYEAIKQKDKIWRAVFLASLASYLAGQFFFFETIGPLLVLYLLFGATNGAFREGTDEIISASGSDAAAGKENKISAIVLGSCLIPAAVLAYSVNMRSLAASSEQYDAFQRFLKQDIFMGLRSFRDSVDSWSPYSWNFKRDYAIAVTGQYFNYPGTVSDEDVLKAVEAMEQVRDEHPADAFNHYALVNLYNEIAAIDPKQYTAKAEAEAKIAFEMSPKRQEIYFYLAKTKTIEKDYAGAFKLLKEALDEDTKVADSHFYYGLLAFAIGDKNTGYSEVKTAISMGREWKTLYEPRTIAGFFADAGHLDEAIDLYKTAWDMSYHSDVESEIKLGVAYFYAGKRDVAKAYLKEAIGSFDVASSPSYGQLKPILDELGIQPGVK